MENDTLMYLDWLAGAVRSKGKGVRNMTGFNQLNWVRKYGTERWKIAQGIAVKDLFKCLNSCVI